MAAIRIERTPVGVAGLGLFGFDHLQLVQQNTEYSPRAFQDSWLVVEGVLDIGRVLGVEGGYASTTLSAANAGKTGDDLIAAIGTPASRGSRVLITDNALGAWALIQNMANQIDEQHLPYIAYGLPGTATPTVNSTSVIASLLFYAGLDISQSWPSGIRYSPGWTTLIGTLGNDNLALTQSFTTLLGGSGNDTLEGSHGTRTDRLYGGVGNDTFLWTEGIDYLHGGQPRMDYATDGVDTVDYTGAGTVVISADPYFVPHKTPTFTAEHAGGTDYLFSIERIEWAANSDHIIVKDGAGLIRDGLQLKLGGQASADHGDTLDFSQQTDAIIVNASAGNALVVKDLATAADEAGLWVENAEWLIGSGGADQIWAADGLFGVEGGNGNDLIDARAAAAFTGLSPDGYDIEIDGGAGADTLVANAGRTLLHGGTGADRFVLSAMTGSDGPIEIVIDDAEAADQILVPYDFFNRSGGDLDGSELMPLLGGFGTFADIQAGLYSVFDWRTQDDHRYGTDPTVGVIQFSGEIDYTMDGNGDLLIYLYLGTPPGSDYLSNPDTETLIRVKAFQDGMLGLQFFDHETAWTSGTWDSNVQTLTNNGSFYASLAAPSAAPATSAADDQLERDSAPPVLGSDSDDIITLTSVGRVEAGNGNDSITGSASADIIDGGSGADTMVGGGGNDSYVVDNGGDSVVEVAGGGYDHVTAFIDFALPDYVENLDLAGAAVTGQGNALANRLVGNDVANVLSGGDGNDVMSGEGGDDTLVGGTGNDAYVYGLGDGNDTVVDGATAGDTSTLVLTGGIAPDGVELLRLTAAPDDLLLRFADGGQLTLSGYFSTANVGLVAVVFDGGAGWSTAEFAARAAAAPMVAELTPIAVDDLYLVATRDHLVIPAAALVANDLSPTGRALTIVAVATDGGGTVTLRADGDLDYFAPSSGETTFTYTVSDGAGTATAHGVVGFDPNHAPTTIGAIPDAALVAGTAFNLDLPVDVFTDADFDPLQLSATLADGSALPAWLIFDATTWTFTGTPPGATADTALDVVVTASDGLDTTTATLHVSVAAAGATIVGDSGDNLLIGTAGNDAIAGGGGNDTISGGAGNDTISGGGGFNVILGGGGDDTLLVGGASANFYDGGDGFDVILGSTGDDLIALSSLTGNLSGIERIDGGGGNDTLRGTSGDDLIDLSAIQLAGIELIDGAGGVDTIIGSAGNDTISGGGGFNVIHGGGGDDTLLVGGASANFYDGGDGFDVILGTAGDDLIALSSLAGNLAGIERIDGGGGNDTLRGTSGDDLIDLSAIQLAGIALIDGAGGVDTIIGSAGNDTISGGGGSNFVHGGGGDDTLLVGGASANFYDGGDGFDVILGTSGDDTIALASVAGNLAGIERIDGGAGNDAVRGTSGDDVIDLSAIQLAGIELIDGAGGADTLIGSAGNDTISGGGGSDLFVMSASGGHDTVADFQRGSTSVPLVDVIDVSAWGFTSLADVFAHTTTNAAGSAIISFDGAASVTLAGIAPGQLKADDFRFA